MTPSRYPWTWLLAVRHLPDPQRSTVRRAEASRGERWLRRFNLFNVAFFGLLLLSMSMMLLGETSEDGHRAPAGQARHAQLTQEPLHPAQLHQVPSR